MNMEVWTKAVEKADFILRQAGGRFINPSNLQEITDPDQLAQIIYDREMEKLESEKESIIPYGVKNIENSNNQ